jgi:hypothetical protein
VQTASEQETQLRLLIESGVEAQSQGQPLTFDLMTELVMAESGSAEFSGQIDSVKFST